ncbi:MAG: hypothetical protein KAR21_14640 [Spirochaetales bacterium]|nr:hypothetical protein [Spirochaetales bacterium]
MKKKKKLVEIDKEFEAAFMDTILNDKEIPHVMVSYSTSAFTNLFQSQNGWGHITAPLEYLKEIEAIYKELKQSQAE